MLTPKVSIIGAGNVGIRYAYSLMIKGLARHILIVDLDRKRAEGEALDLSHGMPYVSPVMIKAGDYSDIHGSSLVVVTAGAKQKPGQTRMELVQTNVGIFKKIVPELMRYAPEAVWLIVSNPVDVLSYAAWKLSGRPWQKILGSGTVLDSTRFRFLLSQHCGIDARNIHAYILGEHGDSEFPVWSTAAVGGTLFKDYCPACGRCDDKHELDTIVEDVRKSAYTIIERKGETSYGIGLAMARITEAILKDQRSILPVSCLINDVYGVSDVYLSLPALVGKEGVHQVQPLQLDKKEQDLLHKSAETIKKAIAQSGI